jgi:hypothetical protein
LQRTGDSSYYDDWRLFRENQHSPFGYFETKSIKAPAI